MKRIIIFCAVLVSLLSGCTDPVGKRSVSYRYTLVCFNSHLYVRDEFNHRGGIAPLFDDDDKLIRCQTNENGCIRYDESKVHLLR